MLTWLAVASLVGSVALAVRWAIRRTDGLGRRRSFPVVSVTALCVIGVAAALPGVLRVRAEHRLANAASTLIGIDVHVHCQTFGETFTNLGAELGYVKYDAGGRPERRTFIKRDQCQALRSYLQSNKRNPSADEVQAVHVLTHEAMHMSGLTSESEAECAAVHHDVRMAELLGADPASAEALARRYWEDDYPRMPDQYRDPHCQYAASSL